MNLKNINLWIMFFLFLFGINIIYAEVTEVNNREVPGLPSNPIPANLEIGIDIDAVLNWENGENTDFVDVYFSSNESLVNIKDPGVKVITNELITQYSPYLMEYDIQYYWRVICKDSLGSQTDGDVWFFTTLFRVDQFPFTESFEIQFPPDNWTISDINNSDGDWIWSTNTNQPAGGGVANGEHLVYFNSYSSSIDSSTRLETPCFDFSGRQDLYLSFNMFHDLGEPDSDDVLIIQVFNTLERTWTYVETIHRKDGSEGWKRHQIELDEYSDELNIHIGFLGVNQSGNDIHIDNVFIDEHIQLASDPVPTQLSSGEYYFDSDPGYGNGTEFTSTSGDSININFDISISTLNPGGHILFVRVCNEAGMWTETGNYIFTRPMDFYIETYPDSLAPLLTSGEYFVDNDLGYSDGIEFTFIQADSIDINVELSKEGYSAGRHIIGYRIRNESGFWSETALTSFDVMDTLFIEIQPDPLVSQLISGEYFVDIDPGFTNGIEFTFSQADSVDINLNLSKEGYSPGRHIIGYRIRNESGFWSEAALTSFEVMDTLFIEVQPDPLASQLCSGEYFFDDDPGYGNGVPFNYPSADSANYSFDYSKESFEPGSHFLGVRMKNEDGFWSETAVFLFSMMRTDYVVVEPDPIPEPITYLSFYFHDESGSYSLIVYDDFTPADEINLMLSLDTSSYSLNDTSYTHVTAIRSDGISSMQAFRQNQPIGSLEAPRNLMIEQSNGQITLSWNPVFSASSYKVYSSNDTYIGFTEDTYGTFDGESWSTDIVHEKKFYYVKASTESIPSRGFGNN